MGNLLNYYYVQVIFFNIFLNTTTVQLTTHNHTDTEIAINY